MRSENIPKGILFGLVTSESTAIKDITVYNQKKNNGENTMGLLSGCGTVFLKEDSTVSEFI